MKNWQNNATVLPLLIKKKIGEMWLDYISVHKKVIRVQLEIL